MNLKDVQGLKYPDEFFIKFFFKQRLHTLENGRFLALGCGNGCNLDLPYQYGFECVGVDLESQLIDFAKENFSRYQSTIPYEFHNADMTQFCRDRKSIEANVLVLANSMYYIDRGKFLAMLSDLKTNALLSPSSQLFLRFRAVDDFRFGKGERVSEHGFIMQNGITGEDGAYCEFYEKEDMLDILRESLNLRGYQVLEIRYDNVQNAHAVRNSDVVIWGEIL